MGSGSTRQSWNFLFINHNRINYHNYRQKDYCQKPYIYNINKKDNVSQIMFKASNQGILSAKLNIEWEKIDFFNETTNCLYDFFKISDLKKDTIVFSSTNTFEKQQYPYWNNNVSLTKKVKFSGSKANFVNSNVFSSSFSYPLDSMPFGDYKIKIECWAKSNNYKYSKNILLILSIDDKFGNIKWTGIPIDEQLFDNENWLNISNTIEYKHNKSNCILNGYLWNKSKSDIIIDDYKIIILNEKKTNN